MSYKRLGDFIELVDERNKDLSITKLLGLSISKQFIPSVANTIGTNMKNYKIIRKNQFACSVMQVRRDGKMPVALLKEFDEVIISQAYPVFKVIDETKLLPDYLMMWFTREEFDREATFHAVGGVRGSLEWEDFLNFELPIPTLEKQQHIVNEYNTVTKRIQLNEKINANLEATAQALYKHWFVDFEFPNAENQPYKSSGGEMVYNEELDKDIPVGWSVERLGENLKFSKNRIEINKLDKTNYISTENMLQNKKGITEASSLPTVNTVTKFNTGSILISNIRPYFKKIWLASFEGGCSNDILCFNCTIDNSLLFYYTLEQDSFFEYVMQGAKGTKMPRGDKTWIMNYYYPSSKNNLEMKFSNNVNLFNRKIQSNRHQSQTLKELRSLLLAKMTRVEEIEMI